MSAPTNCPRRLATDGSRYDGAREWRLALRAFYFACLAHLASATSSASPSSKFTVTTNANSAAVRRRCRIGRLRFQQSHYRLRPRWYGNHQADTDTLDQFAANVNRIKTV